MIHKPSQDPKVTNRKLKAPAHNDEILSDFPHSERSGEIGIRILHQTRAPALIRRQDVMLEYPLRDFAMFYVLVPFHLAIP